MHTLVFFFSTVYLILVFIFHNYLFYSRYFMLILIFDLSIFIIFSGIFKDVTLMKIWLKSVLEVKQAGI